MVLLTINNHLDLIFKRDLNKIVANVIYNNRVKVFLVVIHIS